MKFEFEDAVEYVLKWEGSEYVDDPDDRGGASKYGISSRDHPDVDIKNLTREQAIEIYRSDYWEPNQDIFDCFEGTTNICLYKKFKKKIFDCLVNIGRKNTILLLQRAFNAIRGYGYIRIREDGFLGKQTEFNLIDILGSEYEYSIVVAFDCERAAYYRVLAAKNPSQEKFLNGWLRRAYS